MFSAGKKITLKNKTFHYNIFLFQNSHSRGRNYFPFLTVKKWLPHSEKKNQTCWPQASIEQCKVKSEIFRSCFTGMHATLR